jgi:hypothetical protein
VRAGGFLVGRLERDGVAIDVESGLRTTGAALPGLRRLGVGREHQVRDVAARVTGIGGLTALHENDALFAL